MVCLNVILNITNFTNKTMRLRSKCCSLLTQQDASTEKKIKMLIANTVSI